MITYNLYINICHVIMQISCYHQHNKDIFTEHKRSSIVRRDLHVYIGVEIFREIGSLNGL